MDVRTCSHCQITKPLENFHRCKGFKLGVYPKCKDCRKGFSRLDYKKRRKKITEYCKNYRKTDRGKEVRHKEYLSLRKRTPSKYRANYLMNNAIRDGRLLREPCERCGERAQGHHPDYTKPLDVMWLCKDHHNEWHRHNKPYTPELDSKQL